MNILRTILHAFVDCIGLGTLIEIVQARRRGYPIDVFGRPFHLGADALQLATILCSIVGIYHLSTPWLLASLAFIMVLGAWGWCWGYLCHPRRTRLGERVDVLLAPLFDPEPRKGRR